MTTIIASGRTRSSGSTSSIGRPCGRSSTAGVSRSPSRCSSAAECRELSDLFDNGRFRSTIEMARHRFGDGRYRYFEHPLPEAIATLRSSFYEYLAPSRTTGQMLLRGETATFPVTHEQLLDRCHAAGQRRPTPLILRYLAGDWNALHQDLYGEVFFPFQVLTVLAEPGVDYDGGEFVSARAAAARPEPGARAEPASGSVRDLPHARAAERRQAGLPPGRDAPRREHRDAWAAHGARNHLPRRSLRVTSGRR